MPWRGVSDRSSMMLEVPPALHSLRLAPGKRRARQGSLPRSSWLQVPEISAPVAGASLTLTPMTKSEPKGTQKGRLGADFYQSWVTRYIFPTLAGM